jgi:hypothetical protein
MPKGGLVDRLVGFFDYFFYSADFAVADGDLQAVRFSNVCLNLDSHALLGCGLLVACRVIAGKF